jgi:hypothetical protein
LDRLAGTLIWNHLHAIVLPDDMLKHPMAACSQQAIVLKECFKKIRVDYREIDLESHFVLEGKVERKWFLFDPNMEPQFPEGRKSLNELIQTGKLDAAYQHILSSELLQKIFDNPVYHTPNAPIAPNATMFQQVTRILSLVFPFVLPLTLVLYLVNKERSKKDEVSEEVAFVVIGKSVEELRG